MNFARLRLAAARFARSAPLELRVALLEEGVHSLGAVAAGGDQAEAGLLERVRGALIRVLALLQDPLGLGHGEGALGRDRLPRAHGGGEQLLGREDAVREADAQGGLGVDRLARQHQLLGPGHADAAQQPAGSAEARDDSQVHLGLPEARLARGVDPVAGAGELAAAAERVAVHGGDRRHRERLQRGERGVAQPAEGLGLERPVRAHLGDVGPRGERAPLARHHHRAQVAAPGQLGAARGERLQRGAVEGVERLRPGQREHRHGAALLGSDRLHRHLFLQFASGSTTTGAPPLSADAKKAARWRLDSSALCAQ